jgi:hypothetical protein
MDDFLSVPDGTLPPEFLWGLLVDRCLGEREAEEEGSDGNLMDGLGDGVLEMMMEHVREQREVRRVRKAGHEVVEILLAGRAEKIFDEEVDRLLDETRSNSVTNVVREEGADIVH